MTVYDADFDSVFCQGKNRATALCTVPYADEGEITDKETGPVQDLNRLDLAETETKPVGVSNYSAGAAQSTDHPKKGPWQYLVVGVMFRPLSVSFQFCASGKEFHSQAGSTR